VLETLHTVSRLPKRVFFSQLTFPTLQCLVWMYLWHLTISNFGNSLALLGLPWYFDLSIAIQGLVSVSVQVGVPRPFMLTVDVHTFPGLLHLADL
jgi:hypothetical protein